MSPEDALGQRGPDGHSCAQRSSGASSVSAQRAWRRRAKSSRTRPVRMPRSAPRVEGSRSAITRWPMISGVHRLHQQQVPAVGGLAEAGGEVAATEHQRAGDDQPHGRGGGEDGVELLPGVEAALRRQRAAPQPRGQPHPQQPAGVLAVEPFDVAPEPPQRSRAARRHQREQRAEQQRGVEVDGAHQLAAVEHRVLSGTEVEAEPAEQQDQEEERVGPVQGALGPAEAPHQPRARRVLVSRSAVCRRRRCHPSRAAPRSPGRAPA